MVDWNPAEPDQAFIQRVRAPGKNEPGAQPSNAYALRIQDADFGTAWSLLIRTLPYAFARFAVLLGVAALSLVWLGVGPGIAWWIGNHVSTTFALTWLIPWLVGAGWFWMVVLRYALHLIACGHVAVVTELIVRGTLGDGGQSQFGFGQRVVKARFGEVNALFGLNLVIAGVLGAFHRSLEWVGSLLPIPGIGAIESVINASAGAATRYVDKVVLSYILANPSGDAWRYARDGIIYYCQNGTAILKTSVWIVFAEGALSILLFFAFVAPAAGITALLPEALREVDGAIILALALLMAAAIRASFLKPLFLIALTIRFHVLIRGQAASPQWAARLDDLSEQFRSLASSRQQSAR